MIDSKFGKKDLRKRAYTQRILTRILKAHLFLQSYCDEPFKLVYT